MLTKLSSDSCPDLFKLAASRGLSCSFLEVDQFRLESVSSDCEMANTNMPDLSPTALGRLVAGMTTKEVEAIIGHYHRPNLYQGRRFYAWSVSGGMLRAFFDGPSGTLSKAILDVPEEHRVLDLRGDLHRRIKNCTIILIWNCVTCRKRYRRSALPAFVCPLCNKACEREPIGIRVPLPKRTKVWDQFWSQYKAERDLIDAFARGELRENVKLEIFGIWLSAKSSAKRIRPQTRRKT
jgi:hypothetical protein